METERIKQLLGEKRLVVLFRNVPMEQMAEVSKALVRGGIKILELTFDQTQDDPNTVFKKSFDIIKAAVGDSLCLGAGTVLNIEQVKAAYEAGAEFIVSPNTNKAVIELTKELGMLSVPGALTPTEITYAWDCGADMVKVFPADDMGFHYIWNIRGPLPHIPMMATGGVNQETIPKFLDCGINCVGTGISVVDRKMLAAKDYEGIERLAREHVAVVEKYISDRS
ncbi:MAG: bifunctional 4-hydroxy-2-oxoglutarate aldolase/2-dehydro-3-deoxy-phosphogluconate aldolase [Lachnospiraceae bacterium]|nr:bifunctional 4-hydroxy-2-oxoglutarate aldolase/2-dehydro-3-deoxy-phosphogluconate aldolase [Lachnospiraceae bacterium]